MKGNPVDCRGLDQGLDLNNRGVFHFTRPGAPEEARKRREVDPVQSSIQSSVKVATTEWDPMK